MVCGEWSVMVLYSQRWCHTMVHRTELKVTPGAEEMVPWARLLPGMQPQPFIPGTTCFPELCQVWP